MYKLAPRSNKVLEKVPLEQVFCRIGFFYKIDLFLAPSVAFLARVQVSIADK